VLDFAVEPVHRHHERQPGTLEVVDRRKAVVQPAGVHHDQCPQRTDGQVRPHEPEPVLARRAEQVELDLVVHGDPAEVQGGRGGGLRRYVPGPVDRRGHVGHRRLGGQHRDLRDVRDGRRLAHPEATGDHDLHR
jgi:hypothetical protein